MTDVMAFSKQIKNTFVRQIRIKQEQKYKYMTQNIKKQQN